MLSRGAINGSEMNYWAVNTGNVIRVIEASAAVSIPAGVIITPRRGISGYTLIEVDPAADVLRRLVHTGSSDVAADASCTLVRRPIFVGRIRVDAAGALNLTRRVTPRAAISIHFISTVTPSWRSLRPTKRARTLLVREVRDFVIRREDRQVMVNLDRRQIAVPRDRETIR